MIAAASCYDSTCTTAGAAGYLVGMVTAYVVFGAVALWVYMRIAAKAGYSRWYGFLALIPIAGLVLLLLFAFREWPLEREVRSLRLQLDAAARSSSASRFGRGSFGAPQAADPAAGVYGAPVPGYGAPAAAGYGDPFMSGGYGSAPYGGQPGQPGTAATPGWTDPSYGQQPPYGSPGGDPSQRPPSWG